MENIKLEEVVRLFHKQPAEFIGTLKTDDGEWKPNAMELLIEGHKAFLKKTVEGKEGKAIRLRMKDLEKTVSPLLQKYGLEKSDKLEDTLNTLVETIESKAGEKVEVKVKEKLSDEEIQALPLFKNLLKEGVRTGIEKSNADLKDRYSVLEKRYNQTVAEMEAEKLNAALFKATERALIKAKVALPDKKKDPDGYTARVNRVSLLVKAQNKLKVVDGNIALVDANGDPLEDSETYQPILFDDVASKEGKLLWGENKFDPGKGGAGAQTAKPPVSNGSRFTGSLPKNDAEYMEAYINAKPDERQALEDAYNQSKAAANQQ